MTRILVEPGTLAAFLYPRGVNSVKVEITNYCRKEAEYPRMVRTPI